MTIKSCIILQLQSKGHLLISSAPKACMICCRHVCPYHASRDVLNEGAALVFVTYSQLLDPPVRSANGLDDLLQGAVLVFDEVLHHLFEAGKH